MCATEVHLFLNACAPGSWPMSDLKVQRFSCILSSVITPQALVMLSTCNTFSKGNIFNVTVLAPLTGCTNEHVKMTDDTKVEIMII